MPPGQRGGNRRTEQPRAGARGEAGGPVLVGDAIYERGAGLTAQFNGRRGRRRADQDGQASLRAVAEQQGECLRGQLLTAWHPDERVSVDADPAQVHGERREVGARTGRQFLGIRPEDRGRALPDDAAELDGPRMRRRGLRRRAPSPEPARPGRPGGSGARWSRDLSRIGSGLGSRIRQQRRAGREASGAKGANDGGVAEVEDDYRLAAAERGVYHLETRERHLLPDRTRDQRATDELRPAQL